MTLYIAESNDRIRQCLASLAACVKGIEVVGEAGAVHEAIGGIKRTRPDSVIVALQMYGGSGLDVLTAARLTNPAAVIIALTIDQRREWKLKCLALGADYFFEKSGDVKKIVTTLVLLAHRPSHPGHALQRNVASDSSIVFPIASHGAVLGHHVAGSKAWTANARLIAGGAPQTASKLVLPQIPAGSARFPPLSGFHSALAVERWPMRSL